MSRYWQPDGKGGYQRKANPKPRTPAWTAARAERSANRPSLPLDKWQERDPHGFIRRQVDGVMRLIDPGKIDRWLWEDFTSEDEE